MLRHSLGVGLWRSDEGAVWAGGPLSYSAMVLDGAVAEWLGAGLQSPSREFDSRLRLASA